MGGDSYHSKELLPIVTSVALWGELWRGKTVKCWCDNIAVVATLRLGQNKDAKVMNSWEALARYYLQSYVHRPAIPGVKNKAADALSCNDVTSFHQQCWSIKEGNNLWYHIVLSARMDTREKASCPGSTSVLYDLSVCTIREVVTA